MREDSTFIQGFGSKEMDMEESSIQMVKPFYILVNGIMEGEKEEEQNSMMEMHCTLESGRVV